MRFDIITIFPQLFPPYCNESLLKRAQQSGLLEFRVHNLRDWALDRHRTVDDRPYGGGPGMILRADVVIRCLQAIRDQRLAFRSSLRSKILNPKPSTLNARVIALDPAGKQLTQAIARRLAHYDRLILLCGRYEGFDERVYKFVDEKISIGPYVLSGGELPALILVEAVSRMIPGVIGHPDATKEETHTAQGYVEYPQYTKPQRLETRCQNLETRALSVPTILLSGDHQKIQEWRKKHAKGH